MEWQSILYYLWDLPKVIAAEYPEAFFYYVSAFLLVAHFRKGREAGGPGLVLAFASIMLGITVFAFLMYNSEPMRFRVVAGAVFMFGTMLFVFLSELLLLGWAKHLTEKRGKHWTKEMDYFYLALGFVGVFVALGRIDRLTGRFDNIDLVAPMVLTAALAIRFVKTRAEVGEWNEPGHKFEVSEFSFY
jgi:hypothetical protein